MLTATMTHRKKEKNKKSERSEVRAEVPVLSAQKTLREDYALYGRQAVCFGLRRGDKGLIFLLAASC